jgi:hypothetical protein
MQCCGDSSISKAAAINEVEGWVKSNSGFSTLGKDGLTTEVWPRSHYPPPIQEAGSTIPLNYCCPSAYQVRKRS